LLQAVTVVISIFSFVHSVQERNTLKLVQCLYRHGDRAPFDIYPEDPHRDHWLQVGARQLTNVGKQQHYDLGRLLRRRYQGFLSEEYRYEEIHVRSSDTDRTLASALCNLAGLYPPSGTAVWNHLLPWQPIPVHTVTLSKDALLNFSYHCNRVEELMMAHNKSSEGLTFMEKHTKLIRKMEDLFGVSLKVWDDIWVAVDTLIVERMNNMTVEDWVYEDWDEIVNLNADLFTWYLKGPELKKLKGGPLLTEMITNMEKKVNNIEPNARLYVYSAHDSTLLALLSLLDLYDNVPPGYASCIIVELHQVNRQYLVQILYRLDVESEFIVLTVPGCTPLCPLKTLQKLTRDLVINNFTAACQAKGTSLTVYQS